MEEAPHGERRRPGFAADGQSAEDLMLLSRRKAIDRFLEMDDSPRVSGRTVSRSSVNWDSKPQFFWTWR